MNDKAEKKKKNETRIVHFDHAYIMWTIAEHRKENEFVSFFFSLYWNPRGLATIQL